MGVMWRDRGPLNCGQHVIDRSVPPYPMSDAVQADVTPSVYDRYSRCAGDVRVGDVLLTDGRIQRDGADFGRVF